MDVTMARIIAVTSGIDTPQSECGRRFDTIQHDPNSPCQNSTASKQFATKSHNLETAQCPNMVQNRTGKRRNSANMAAVKYSAEQFVGVNFFRLLRTVRSCIRISYHFSSYCGCSIRAFNKHHTEEITEPHSNGIPVRI